MDKQEKIDLLEEAQDKLFEVIELLEAAVGDDANVKAYLIDQLKTNASDGHGFLCNNLTIDQVIADLGGR